MVARNMEQSKSPKFVASRAIYLLLIVFVGFSVTVVNELRDPSIALHHVLAGPIVLTVVGHDKCPDFKLADKLIKTVLPPTQTKLLTRVVSLEDLEQFRTWLATRQDEGQIIPDFEACPISFVTPFKQNPFLVGGIRDLVAFLELRYPGTVDYESYRSRIFVPATASSTHLKNPESPIEAAEKVNKNDGLPVPPIVAQIPPLSPKVVSTFRQSGAMTNFKPLKEYFVKHQQFKFIPGAAAGSGIILVQDRSSAQHARKRSPKALVNHLGYGGQACIGGTKGAQLRCRIEKAARDGCQYDTLGVQPMQYRLWIPDECRNFLDNVCTKPGTSEKLWIEKPSGGEHGVGMRVHRGCGNLHKRFSDCTPKMLRVIAMEYVDAALIDGHKFDMRTYSLVASTKPFLFFYHDGFARRATTAYNASTSDVNAHITNAASQKEDDDHFWDFDRLGEYLHQSMGFPVTFLKDQFRKEAMRIQNFALQATWHDFNPSAGNFQVYAHDWILDKKGNLHMLEANGRPWVRNYPIPGYPEIWDSMMELVVQLHTDPVKLGPVTVGMTGPKGETTGSGPNGSAFQFKDWILFFNSDEEQVVGAEYNSCQEFSSKPTGVEIVPVEQREILSHSIESGNPVVSQENQPAKTSSSQANQPAEPEPSQENQPSEASSSPGNQPDGISSFPGNQPDKILSQADQPDENVQVESSENANTNQERVEHAAEPTDALEHVRQQAEQDAFELAQDELMKQDPQLVSDLEDSARNVFFSYVKRRGAFKINLTAIIEKYHCSQSSNAAGALQLECTLSRGTQDSTHFYVLFPSDVSDIPQEWIVSATEGDTEQASPVVLITGGMHGNEAAGREAAVVLRNLLTPTRGLVVVIPCLNPRASRKGVRYIPMATKEVQDLNRDFPVDLNQPTKGQLATRIWELAALVQPHLYIDLHEGWGFYADTKQNYVPGMQLVSNKKFSKGSSVISTTEAIPLAKRMLADVNFLKHKPAKRFFLHTPPVGGGLAMRLNSAFNTFSVLLETTSKTQQLALRRSQQVILVVAALRSLFVVPSDYDASQINDNVKNIKKAVAPTLAPLVTSEVSSNAAIPNEAESEVSSNAAIPNEAGVSNNAILNEAETMQDTGSLQQNSGKVAVDEVSSDQDSASVGE